MQINDKELRDIYQAYVADKIPASRVHCPQTKTLARSFKSSISRRRKKKIIDHLSKCAYCSEEFDFLTKTFRFGRELAGKAEALRQQERNRAACVTQPFPSWKWSHTLGFVGIAAVLISAAFLFHKLGIEKSRGKWASSIHLYQPLNKAFRHQPLFFKWSEITGSDAYILEIFDNTLYPFWKSDKLPGNSYLLPSDVIRNIPKGESFFWMVSALKEGEKIAESELQKVVIRE